MMLFVKLIRAEIALEFLKFEVVNTIDFLEPVHDPASQAGTGGVEEAKFTWGSLYRNVHLQAISNVGSAMCNANINRLLAGAIGHSDGLKKMVEISLNSNSKIAIMGDNRILKQTVEQTTCSGRGERIVENPQRGAESHPVIEQERQETLQPPPMYKVILNNDDYTPMEFVVEILRKFFAYDTEEATRLMLTVHYQGKAICGVFTAEIAEMKAALVNRYAREHEHPLLCTLEKA